MVAAARISHKMEILDKNEVTRLRNVIARAGLPTELPRPQLKRLIQAMKHDKKVWQGKIRFVLPKSIGNVFISDEVSFPLIEEVLVAGNEKT